MKKNIKALILVNLFAISGVQAGAFVNNVLNKTGNVLKQNKVLLGALGIYGVMQIKKVQDCFNTCETVNTKADEITAVTKAVIGLELLNLASNSSPRLSFLKGHTQRLLACFAAYKVWNSAWIAQLYNAVAGGINHYVLPLADKVTEYRIQQWNTVSATETRVRHIGILFATTGMVPTVFAVGNKSTEWLINKTSPILAKVGIKL